MKIAVTSTGPGLDFPVDYRFGRCAYFIIVDTDTMEYQALPNPAVNAPGGAGTLAAQFVASQGVTHVLTGEVGPNAYPALMAAGVTPVTGVTGTVREAVEAFKAGRIPAAAQAAPPQWGYPQPAPMDRETELKALKSQLEVLKSQLNGLLERIEKLEKEKNQ